jgi:ABC-type dipeptide/oligopeptide/nickel transport system permease component
MVSLEGRPDITLDALRHLVLPVFSLSLIHWATLARVTRALIIDEKEQEYILAARARGLHPRHIMLRHAFPNVVPSALTSSALSASQLIMGVFIIEQIFDLGGVSALITRSIFNAPDAALVMGFAVYSILLVIPLMVVLDILKVLVDPRIAKGLLK